MGIEQISAIVLFLPDVQSVQKLDSKLDPPSQMQTS